MTGCHKNVTPLQSHRHADVINAAPSLDQGPPLDAAFMTVLPIARLAGIHLALLAGAIAVPAAAEPTVADLQRQIDELKTMIAELKAGRSGTVPAAAPAPAPVAAAPAQVTASQNSAPAKIVLAAAPRRSKPWYEKLTLRGYTQLRVSGLICALPLGSAHRVYCQANIVAPRCVATGLFLKAVLSAMVGHHGSRWCDKSRYHLAADPDYLFWVV